MPKPTVTLQHIANAAGTSKATVSYALRNSSRISIATRQRIHKIAQQLGYQRDPLLASFMRARRKTLTNTEDFTLGIIHDRKASQVEGGKSYLGQTLQAFRQEATRLGYKVDYFNPYTETMPTARLAEILKTRGIRGLLLPPTQKSRGRYHLRLPWENFTCISLDSSLIGFKHHRVHDNNAQDCQTALRQIWKHGYRRTGLAIQNVLDERMNYAQASMFTYLTHKKGYADIPPYHLQADDLNGNATGLAKWIKVHDIEVILSSSTQIPKLLAIEGLEVPRDIAFVSLSKYDTGSKFAGIRLATEEVGRKAAWLLAQELELTSEGCAQASVTLMVEGEWINGKSLPKHGHSSIR